MTGYADDTMSANESNIFTNPWKVQRSTPHHNIRNRKGDPIGVTSTKSKNLLPVTEIFGKPIHEIILAELPRRGTFIASYSKRGMVLKLQLHYRRIKLGYV